jgi:hypothetical protein
VLNRVERKRKEKEVKDRGERQRRIDGGKEIV